MRKVTKKTSAKPKVLKPKVHKVVLSPDTVVQVVVPKKAQPVIVHKDPSTVEIGAIPSNKRMTWWEYLFGG